MARWRPLVVSAGVLPPRRYKPYIIFVRNVQMRITCWRFALVKPAFLLPGLRWVTCGEVWVVWCGAGLRPAAAGAERHQAENPLVNVAKREDGQPGLSLLPVSLHHAKH